jgi:hypothetical protein
MSEFVRRLKEGWQILLILGTLIGSGVGWTSYLQSQILLESVRTRRDSELLYFTKTRGEL